MAETRDRELVGSVRAELAAIDPRRPCCRAAEREGLGMAARGRARSAAVARLAVRIADEASDTAAERPWEELPGHCRVAWLRGRFLTAGSLSLGPGGTHLELVVPVSEAQTLQRRLAEAGLPTTARLRRGRSVLVAKDLEAILGFLRTCGASVGVLEVEARQVMRQLRGHLNRVLNAESANLRRSVEASIRQLEVIDSLSASGRLARLPPLERAVAEARLGAPEASLSELAARLGVTRSRVQRALERLVAEAQVGAEPRAGPRIATRAISDRAAGPLEGGAERR